MGEARLKAVAAKDDFVASVKVAVDRVSRALVIQVLKQAKSKGSVHARTLAQALRTFLRDDDWSYMEDGGDPTRPPGNIAFTLIKAPPKVLAVLQEAGMEMPEDGRVSIVVRFPGSENDSTVLDISKTAIDFVLKEVWEEATLAGAAIIKLAQLQDDLEKAKAGTYELPAEFREDEAPEPA